MSVEDNIQRWLDGEPPDWPEALIKLIDALRDYIRADTDLAEDLLSEDSITREQYEDGMKEVRRLQAILKELEDHGVDPTLHGLIKWVS